MRSDPNGIPSAKRYRPRRYDQGRNRSLVAKADLGFDLAAAFVVGDEESDIEFRGSITQFANNGPTLQGHPGAAGAAAVGAAFYFDTPRCGTTPATLETYSSAGGLPILFGTDGTRVATPVIRQKPDFVGPDGVNNTFLGYTLAADSPPYPSNGLLTTTSAECQNDPSYPNFFGTSAATPHAAGIAALMLQANSAATPTQIYQALQQSALPMGNTSPNYNSGYGFIQADAALARIPPGVTFTIAAASVTDGNSTTLSWSSITATSCQGDWTNGSLPPSGTATVTPPYGLVLDPGVPSPYSYGLTCQNAAGLTTTSEVGVNVDPKSGGGGGGLGGGALLGLAVLSALRLARAKLKFACGSRPAQDRGGHSANHHGREVRVREPLSQIGKNLEKCLRNPVRHSGLGRDEPNVL